MNFEIFESMEGTEELEAVLARAQEYILTIKGYCLMVINEFEDEVTVYTGELCELIEEAEEEINDDYADTLNATLYKNAEPVYFEIKSKLIIPDEAGDFCCVCGYKLKDIHDASAKSTDINAIELFNKNWICGRCVKIIGELSG